MKTTIALCMALGMLCIGNSFQNQFPRQYEQGTEYCNSIAKLCDSIAGNYCLDGKIILSIGLPEACRYSSISDQIEYSALSYFSLNDSSCFDFSIGEFQMKPSFAKRIESLALKHPALSDFRSVFNYSHEQTETPLVRLEEPDWQIKYICCMVTYLKAVHPKQIDDSVSGISFLAAAYNYGFESPVHEIVAWQSKKAFPYGLNSGQENLAYAEISANYYLNQ